MRELVNDDIGSALTSPVRVVSVVDLLTCDVRAVVWIRCVAVLFAFCKSFLRLAERGHKLDARPASLDYTRQAAMVDHTWRWEGKNMRKKPGRGALVRAQHCTSSKWTLATLMICPLLPCLPAGRTHDQAQWHTTRN